MKTGEKCKKCGTGLEAEFVDIGVGWEQVTEGLCPNQCDYIEWEYKQYKNKKALMEETPLSFDEWLKSVTA